MENVHIWALRPSIAIGHHGLDIGGIFHVSPDTITLLIAHAGACVAAGPRPQRPGGLVEHSQVPTNTYSLIQLQVWNLKCIFLLQGDGGLLLLKSWGRWSQTNRDIRLQVG